MKLCINLLGAALSADGGVDGAWEEIYASEGTIAIGAVRESSEDYFFRDVKLPQPAGGS